MRVCPTCRLRYTDDSTTCLVDQSRLQHVKDPRIGTVVAGRYTLEDVLGRGGMATVYRANHAMAHRQVAVKIIHDRFAHDQGLRERVQREASASKQLAHPNVVEMYDHGETDDGLPYLVMELLSGDPLDQYLQRRGVLSSEDVVSLSLQIARGLSRAHDFGVVHRDIKPENVFVCRSDDGSPVVKLVDFGIALSPDDPRLTGTGELLGSPRYMAPERFRERAQVTPSSDLYSLGVLMFELLTGRLPFESESITGFILAHLEETPPHVRDLVPTCAPELDRLVFELMAKQTVQRPVDAHAVVSMLNPLASESARRIRTVSMSSSLQPQSGGETLRLDHWAIRASAYQHMLERAWPVTDPPIELDGALAELNATIARLKALHRKADEVETALAQRERELRLDRERLGHAVATLGEDLSKARAEQRRGMRTQPGAHVGNWQDSYRMALAKALQLDAKSPDRPTKHGLDTLQEAASAYRKWLEIADHTGVTDLEFQLDALRGRLERLEQSAQAKRAADAARLESNGTERRTLESRLVSLSQTLSVALRPRPELADLFAALQKPSATA